MARRRKKRRRWTMRAEEEDRNLRGQCLLAELTSRGRENTTKDLPKIEYFLRVNLIVFRGRYIRECVHLVNDGFRVRVSQCVVQGLIYI